jgi:hypothetical protein
MRGFTRDAYKKMNPRTPGMEFATEMIVKASRANLRIAEVPITLYPDKRSRPPHLRSFRDGWRHLQFIMTYAPNHLYMIPGVLLFVLGTALQLLLITGPAKPFGFYMGIHFLALGCLMTLVGFNIINLGVLAKVMVASQAPEARNRVVDWLMKYFTLERGLIAGGVPLAIGVVIDSALLWRWLKLPAPMVESIHIVFVATSAIAIGFTMIFSSFLIWMFLQDIKAKTFR